MRNMRNMHSLGLLTYAMASMSAGVIKRASETQEAAPEDTVSSHPVSVSEPDDSRQVRRRKEREAAKRMRK